MHDITPNRFTALFPNLSLGLKANELDALLNALEFEDISAGETPIAQGTETEALYLIWSGSLNVYVSSETGEKEVGKIKSGEMFGEITLMDPGPASATVRCDVGCTALVLMRSDLETLWSEHPSVAAKFIRQLSREVTKRIRSSTIDLNRIYATSDAVGLKESKSFDTELQKADLMRDIAALSKIPHISNVALSQVTTLAEALDIVEAPSGHVFMEEGEIDDCIYFVISGSVQLITSASGKDRIIDTHEVGEVFGLISLVDNGPKWATAKAAGSVRVGRLGRNDYLNLTKNNAPLALSLQQALGAQLAKNFRKVSTLIQDQLVNLPTEIISAPLSDDSEVDYDVAVLGGGPMGMIYAQWVKRMRPESKVVILERRQVPGYKVGESTLSTTVRCFLAMGFTMPQMRRLFGNKGGIRFWWMGTESKEPESECDITDLEETFQIERRVFEMALQRLTKEQGIDFKVNTHVEIDDCQLDGKVKQLACIDENGESFTIKSRFVCDATGPAAVLPRHLGTYRKDPAIHDTFQTNCYFAYFRQKKQVPLARWQEPATRHLCTPQGWIWFITVHSWESADDETMLKMVNDVMDHDSEEDSDVPPRKFFQEKHGTEFEPITSIGITVRDDMDTAKDLPIQKRFMHYAERYPAFAWILEHYELVEKPYREKRRPYAAFLGLAHDSTQVAGKGWVAIGDSAQFSNPLFSHGINYGSGTSYMAAVDTVKALDEKNYEESAFAEYSKYGSELYPVLVQETDMLYRSWAHPLAFEKTMNAKFHWGGIDVLAKGHYSSRDPYVFDPLNPTWTGLIKEVREIEKKFEADQSDPEKMAHDIAAIIDPFNKMCRDIGKTKGIDFNTVFNNFDGDGNRVINKLNKPRAYFKVYQCPTCNYYQDDVLKGCPNCGTDNPDQFMGDTSILASLKKKNDVTAVTASIESTAKVETSALTAVKVEASTTQVKRTKKMFNELKVARVAEETADSKSFYISVPDDLKEEYLSYRPGQFLTLSLDIEGETHKRAYSLSSAPSIDDDLRITVKRVKGGMVSNWLCDNIKAGDSLNALAPDGRFTVPDKKGDLYLFAAGSGVTAVLSIAKEFLNTSDRKVRFVYVNRNKEETIFRNELDALKKQYNKRFKVIHRLGKAEGRIDTRDVQSYCDEITSGLYFVCGPWGFMDVVEEGLLDMGVDDDRVHVEKFASPKKKVKSQEAPKVEAVAKATQVIAAKTITMNIFGEEHIVPNMEGCYLTESAAEVGVDAPFSCEEGFCGTCICRVVEGTAEMDIDDALSKGQKKRGMILACQARPTSDKLIISFES
ncbi:MAG: 3-ketosteroid 9alpha-monooxygenase subunit B [Roseivirga sp.]|jgi:3-ketosteroid 9alpha-monooxygenase subunit B